MTSEMEIRGYKPADETFYDYKDEEETPRGTHHTKEDDEDIDNSTVGRYASGEDFKHCRRTSSFPWISLFPCDVILGICPFFSRFIICLEADC